MPVSLLWALRWPLIGLAVTGAIYATYLYIGRLQDRADAADVRANIAETRAELNTAVAQIGATREIEIATIAPVPTVRTRLVQLCEQSLRPATETGVVNEGAGTNAHDRQPDLDGLAADLAACRANSAALKAHVELLDVIYNANNRWTSWP